jgi:hypothetical protein
MTESNVVHAFGSAPPSKLEVDMLKEIEELIVEVKAGRIVSIGFAAVCSDGGVSSAFVRGAGSHYALIGAVENLKMRLIADGHDE